MKYCGLSSGVAGALLGAEDWTYSCEMHASLGQAWDILWCSWCMRVRCVRQAESSWFTV